MKIKIAMLGNNLYVDSVKSSREKAEATVQMVMKSKLLLGVTLLLNLL